MPIKSLVVTFVQLQVSVSKMAGMKNAGHSWNIQANLAFTGHPENTFEIFKSCHGKKNFGSNLKSYGHTERKPTLTELKKIKLSKINSVKLHDVK